MNTFGNRLRLTTFGESHGPAIGGVIDGFPSGFKIDFDSLQNEINKRRPGNSLLVTQRNERDCPQFLSGISSEGITLGTPIGFIIWNRDNRSSDYEELANIYRPNHADFTYQAKYGIRDYRGGGRASARETANWVVAGALAGQWLEGKGISISSLLTSAGNYIFYKRLKEKLINNPLEASSFSLSKDENEELHTAVIRAKEDGESISGSVSCLVTGISTGIGEPVFDKLQAKLAHAMMSINAAKAFEYGVGIDSSLLSGSLQHDVFYKASSGEILTETNFSGGIQGGISNGMPIFFTVFFKPTPTVLKEIKTIDEAGNSKILKIKGRHDPCVAVRAVQVVKAMTALVIADSLL